MSVQYMLRTFASIAADAAKKLEFVDSPASREMLLFFINKDEKVQHPATKDPIPEEFGGLSPNP